MSIPLISVIVPIYNTEKYLGQCLDSLLNQTVREIEIICVNDGSMDNSEKIVHDYMQKDDRIRYIYQENQGRSATRNKGIEAATAPYLMFCDSDDWYDETMCEKMYQAITKHDVDFACCGIQMVYDIENPISEKSDKNYYRIKYDGVVSVTGEMIDNLDGSSCNKIMKKELLDKYDIRYPTGLNYEDSCLFFQLLSVSQKIYCLPQYLYYYRRHCDSIMVSTFGGNSKAIDHIKIMEVVYQFLTKNNLFDKWEKDFYSAYLDYFYSTYHYLPRQEKKRAFDVAIPFMTTIRSERIKLLSDEEQFIWKTILKRTYSEGVKRIKIGKITLIKITRKYAKYQIQFLGIRLFSKKIKKNQIVYSVLYIPVFKRSFKNA